MEFQKWWEEGINLFQQAGMSWKDGSKNIAIATAYSLFSCAFLYDRVSPGELSHYNQSLRGLIVVLDSWQSSRNNQTRPRGRSLIIQYAQYRPIMLNRTLVIRTVLASRLGRN